MTRTAPPRIVLDARVLQRRLAADVGVRAGAQTLGQDRPDLELVQRPALGQGLEVGLAVGAFVKIFKFSAVNESTPARAGVSTKPGDGVLVNLELR